MSEARLLQAGRATAYLPESGDLRRAPRPARKSRPPTFFERFEDRALVYDCFWHADGERVLIVGPPPMNLKPLYGRASYHALPSQAALTARYHASLSTMITELGPVPAGTTAITMQFAGERYELPIEPNRSDALAGRRVLFTMSKDNELGWIAEWARWHVQLHGTDAIVLFDNGSTRYATTEIEETLLAIPGLNRVAVLDWPGRYGETDVAVLNNPFYVLFLQVASMSVALRRFADAAFGMLNCDVDELVETPDGTDIYAIGAASRRGLAVMRGRFVEANPEPFAPDSGRMHRHFQQHLVDPAQARSPQKKWVIDPSRGWVKNLNVHPYMHWIRGRPWFGKAIPEGVRYHHFKAINTNWKEDRNRPAAAAGLVHDEFLGTSFKRIGASR